MSAESSPRVFTDVTVDPFVRGLLHQPANPNGKGLVLTHGAGSNCQAPLLVALAESFTGAGFLVLRCDLPFRQDRPYGPPGPHDAKRDRAGLKNATMAIRNLAAGPVFLGGHSYGGRQASMLCAEERNLEKIPGLLLDVLSAAPSAQTCPASNPAFFQSADSCTLRAGHARSFRVDRGNRAGIKAGPGQDEVARQSKALGTI